jgi:hypothetical protein
MLAQNSKCPFSKRRKRADLKLNLKNLIRKACLKRDREAQTKTMSFKSNKKERGLDLLFLKNLKN